MAQFVVRNVERSVKLRLQRRARRNGHSMEEEVRAPSTLPKAAQNGSRKAGSKGALAEI
jgi:plasmid stability protein